MFFFFKEENPNVACLPQYCLEIYVFIYTPWFQFALCLWVNIYLFMMSPFGRVGFFRHASIGRVQPAQCFSTECVCVWSAPFFLDFNYSELLPRCPERWTLTFPIWPRPLSPRQHHASTIEGSKPRKPKLCQELIKYTPLTEHTAYGASLKSFFFAALVLPYVEEDTAGWFVEVPVNSWETACNASGLRHLWWP